MVTLNPFDNPPATLARSKRIYDRVRDLPRLVALWPEELAPAGTAAHEQLVWKLRAALRRERQRGLSGHFAYDLARHRQLLDAYKAETVLLRQKRRKNPMLIASRPPPRDVQAAAGL